MPPSAPSSFALWLEEALAGWILPVGALVLVGAAGALYAAGLLPEGATAAVLAVLTGLLAAVYVGRPGLSRRADRASRLLALVAAVGTFTLAVLPALQAVLPGTPFAEGTLAQVGDALPLPPGVPSRVRLLVHVPLPKGGTPKVSFRIGGAASPIEGQLERAVSYARVGRGGRSAVSIDHSSTFVAANVGSASALRLERLTGDAAGPVTVSVYRDLLPPPLHWLLPLLVLAVAAMVEARLRRGNPAVVSAMALVFGLLVEGNATPTAAVGTALGALVLGAIAGAAVGGLAGVIAKRLVAPSPEAVPAARRAPAR